MAKSFDDLVNCTTSAKVRRDAHERALSYLESLGHTVDRSGPPPKHFVCPRCKGEHFGSILDFPRDPSGPEIKTIADARDAMSRGYSLSFNGRFIHHANASFIEDDEEIRDVYPAAGVVIAYYACHADRCGWRGPASECMVGEDDTKRTSKS